MPFQLSAAFASVRCQLGGAEKKNEESEERRHSDTHLVTRRADKDFVKLNASVEKGNDKVSKRGGNVVLA